MKFTKPALTALCLFIFSCTSTTSSEYGWVDWYIGNGTGSRMVLVAYDNICKRTYFRIRVARTGETGMATCSDSEGRADIRYRHTGGFNGSENPWRDSRISRNQALIVR